MYEAFYGLREKPFNLTPDPKFLYLSEKHKEAFAHLLYGIKNRSGFVMLTGEIGTGKTTICRNLLNQLDSDTEVAFIFNPFLGPVELLRKINAEFGIDTKADNLLGLTEELNIHLLNAAARGKNCVLVIDEAQNLDPKVLEQIRLLSNLETESNKLIQIILIGQPELGEKLALHELRQLNQRITARYHLKPLNAVETLQYIAYRIHVAGGRKSVSFTRAAVKQVYKASGGTPRMINAVCDRCLLIGYTREEHEINPAIVRRAAKEIKGDKVRVKRPREGHFLTRLLPSPSLIIAALLVVIVALLFSGSLDRLSGELGKFNRGMFGNDTSASASPPMAGVTEAAAPDKPVSQRSIVPSPDQEATISSAEAIIAKRVLDRLNSTPKKAAVLELLAKSPTELLSVSPETARDTGIAELFKVWGMDAPAGFSGDDAAESLAKFFQSKSLACELLRPGTEQLIAMNFPALVRVKVNDQLRWVTLVRADDEIMTVTLGPEKVLPLRRTSFRDIYQNEAVIPWRDLTPTAPLLLPGQKGDLIVTLKQNLRSLNLINIKNTHDVYDGETTSAVAALQAETGLKMDGKAGPQVRMVLASWTGANGAPTLRQRRPLDIAAMGTASMASKENLAKPAEKPSEPVQKPEQAPPTPAVAAEKADSGQGESPASVAPETPVASPVPATPEKEVPESSVDSEKSAEIPVSAAIIPSITSVLGGGEYRADAGTQLQIRELPAPTGMTPLAPGEGVVSGERTEPVSGSSPLVPHDRSAA